MDGWKSPKQYASSIFSKLMPLQLFQSLGHKNHFAEMAIIYLGRWHFDFGLVTANIQFLKDGIKSVREGQPKSNMLP